MAGRKPCKPQAPSKGGATKRRMSMADDKRYWQEGNVFMVRRGNNVFTLPTEKEAQLFADATTAYELGDLKTYGEKLNELINLGTGRKLAKARKEA